MTIEEFQRRPKISEVHLSFDPLYVWLTPHIRIQIEKGDSVLEVAKASKKHLPKMSKREVLRLVALWFYYGERLKAGTHEEPMREKHIAKFVKTNHRYLKKS